MLVAAVRARFDFDRMTRDQALALSAEHPRAELIARLRQSATTSRRMPLSGPLDPLMDLVIHAQDIVRPLGRVHESPPEVVAACLVHVAAHRFMGGPARLRGVRVVSADSGWTLGDGAELRGPDPELLLVAAGRPAGLAGLSGPGVGVVAPRLA